MFNFTKVSSLAIGLALVGGLGLSTAASALSMTDLASGYSQAQVSADTAKETAEGKCGEGKCGSAAEAS
ncbi:putative low-complexity protein [Pseudomonas frederiksbergensis]|uniref:HvfA family oxazolone/thioamide-modified RiPP metallophore n=1 Tax=Pseudomonas frederiksbergensis TaxID=104087 RepID=UPI003D23AF8D